MYAILNKIIIQGRLTADPELRYTQNQTAVASFTVAVERDYSQNGEKETDFVSCVAWRQAGEFVSKYFHKGDMIVVTGRMQSRDWTDNNGNKRRNWEIQVEHSYFGGSKSDSQSSGQGSQGGGYYAQQGQYSAASPQQNSYNSAPPQYGTPSQQYGAPPQQYQQGTFTELDEDDGDLPF